MIQREIWVKRLHAAWTHRPVVWLSGVRRVGKTTLAQMIDGALYLNCDLPTVRRSLDDPELFLVSAVDPEFGRQLARERPDLLLAYAGAEHRGTQAPAIAFLMAISGEDFGTDLEAWTTWLSGRSDSGRSVGE